MQCEPIGIVRSAVKRPVDENWGGVVCAIQIAEPLAAGLRGLEQFSHALIVFWLHEISFDPATEVLRRPGGQADMPEIGVFAHRSRHRPNPIGITAVEIVKVEPDKLIVKGLDAIDGTPVLDIKPYVPVFDRIEAPTVPAWVGEFFRGYF